MAGFWMGPRVLCFISCAPCAGPAGHGRLTQGNKHADALAIHPRVIAIAGTRILSFSATRGACFYALSIRNG